MKQPVTGCGSHFENPTNFKILKEPLLVQKQTLHQQKALDISYLEPEGQGRGIIMRAWQCHRRQRVKKPPSTCKKSTKNAFCAKWAWHPHDTATPLCFQFQIAEIQSFLLMYCLFLYQQWFYQNIEKGLRFFFKMKQFSQSPQSNIISKKYFLQLFSIF